MTAELYTIMMYVFFLVSVVVVLTIRSKLHCAQIVHHVVIRIRFATAAATAAGRQDDEAPEFWHTPQEETQGTCSEMVV